MWQARRRQHGGHALRKRIRRDSGDEAGLARGWIAHHHHLTARAALARHHDARDGTGRDGAGGAAAGASSALRGGASRSTGAAALRLHRLHRNGGRESNRECASGWLCSSHDRARESVLDPRCPLASLQVS